MSYCEGSGLVNTLINKLPFELHYPNYSYLGPGTKLEKRLRENSQPINKLDEAAKEHDIFYRDNKELKDRHQADKILEHKAWDRVMDKDASLGEKTAAYITTNLMKIKRKIGAGQKSMRKIGKSLPLKRLIRDIARLIKKTTKKDGNGLVTSNNNLKTHALQGLKIARKIVKKAGGRKRFTLSERVLPLPKVGGFLPLIPLFAGLSAIGALTGGVAGVAKAVMEVKSKEKQLRENERHNKTMEALVLGKKGSGLYLKLHRGGAGLYLKKQPTLKN